MRRPGFYPQAPHPIEAQSAQGQVRRRMVLANITHGIGDGATCVTPRVCICVSDDLMTLA